MSFESLKQRVRALPEIAAWPEMLHLIERVAYRESRSIWDYPVLACEAVGGKREDALPGSAAIFCSLLSIHLVDDMLDEEPDGVYRRLGSGATANMALAFQAAAYRMLDHGSAQEIRPKLQATLASAALATAFGQNLDTRDISSEAEYWRVIEAKTPPLFTAALSMGALLGGATAELAEDIGHLGRLLGRFVQVSDDLTDALRAPAGSDWKKPGSCLPLLYAFLAEYPQRADFKRLMSQAEDPVMLAQAQAILLRSGAVSYCALKLIELAQQIRDLLSRLPLAVPEPLERLVAGHERTVNRLFESVGVETAVLVSA